MQTKRQGESPMSVNSKVQDLKEKAEAAYDDEDNDKALSLLEEALKLNPEDREIIHDLGAVYSAKGEYDLALDL